MALVVLRAVLRAHGVASLCSSAGPEELDELLSRVVAAFALAGGAALEAGVVCKTHTPGGPLGRGLGGGGGCRGVARADSPLGGGAAGGPAMGPPRTASMRFLTAARTVESLLTLFLNHAALETLG